MILIRENYDISKKSFIHVGGKVKEYIECDEVNLIIQYLSDKEFIALGNTSKLLFAFDKTNISYVNFINKKVVFFKDSFFVYSGASLNYLNYILMKKKITGFEYLSTIPGCVGGSIVNNSSFLNQCISDLLIEILVFENNKLLFIKKEDINFKYRESGLIKNNFLIIGARFKLISKPIYAIKNNFNRAKEYRLLHQEKKMNTLGSTFKNIDNIKIGEILDKLKYKGYIYNQNLSLSKVHANFILVKPYTNYCEINNFINFLKQLLYNYLQKEIKEEIQIIYHDGTRNQ